MAGGLMKTSSIAVQLCSGALLVMNSWRFVSKLIHVHSLHRWLTMENNDDVRFGFVAAIVILLMIIILLLF